MTPPASYQELTEVLRSRLPKLVSGQLRIAHLVLADPEGTAYRGISEAARLAEVRESSIARFANSLGLSGYPAIMELCRVWLAERAQLARRAEDDGHEPPGGTLSAALEQEQTNLARTFNRLDRASWLSAVATLAEAGAVHVLGLRESRPVAELLSRRLHARQLGVSLPDEIRDISGVLVAISVRRYAADTVRAAEYARDHDVRVVALTDNPASPLADHAHVALFAETVGIGNSQSLTALAALAQALAREVALRRGDRAPEDDLPASFGFYQADLK
ncbi:MurR/RpiR family transcriptional regulator [Amycolatopsis alkalitolerans]|uniref:MurR/RpiR family transcriptional regulator n=1 Tax=Amycolatopsis alkalitolerans TaxID=2547244 RepID=A0A5C4M8W6_9PSEU|nr:MurR/RpiR family transcriptional regulator [Amycolatopsis alkalitolerans]TNC28223.1 MurR/RpiR family transcriptional regulator [Amycolatopsis alkalitolerans]